MKPRKHNETHYIHQDISQVIERGGFHFTSGDWLENYVQGDSKTALAIAAVGVAGAIGGLASAAVATGPIAAACAISGAAQAVVTTAAYARFEAWRSRHSRPLLARSTVTAHVSNSFGEPGREELASIVRFRHRPPTTLVPGVLENDMVDRAEVGRVAAAMTLAKDKALGAKQMAASLLREGVSARTARDTVRHAGRLVDYVIPNVLRPQSWGLTYKLAIALPPFVWAATGLLMSTPIAAYIPPAVLYYVVASFVITTPLSLLIIPAWFLLALWESATEGQC